MKKRSLLIAVGVIVFGIIASIALVSQTKKKEIAAKRAFPQHTVYQAGTIKPDNLSQEEMDTAVMMPLGDYFFSKKFGWVSDKFGISWQLTLPI